MMWHLMVLLLPVLLPTLVIKTTTCSNQTNDVIVRYAGHAEADLPPERENRIFNDITTTTLSFSSSATTTHKPSISPKSTTPSSHASKRYQEDADTVLFVPNEPPVMRIEDELDHSVKIHDLMARREMIDALDKQYQAKTDAPIDVVFIVDKNKDQREKKPSTRRLNKHTDHVPIPHISKPVNCSTLECTNNIEPICGKKQNDGKTQYRLFLNECFFDKVNCRFKYRKNRYTKTAFTKCSLIGYHSNVPPSNFPVRMPENDNRKKKSKLANRKRNFSSRRSLAVNIGGEFCSHPCPTTCSDDYDPVCAISATGQNKVFMNHCKLDDNSCQFAVVWHKRPLSDCVGGMKADLRNNRHFVAWLQRVGLVDTRGRLLSD